MSPIRPENRGRYPDDWKAISDRIRFERAGGRCECTGECGMPAHAGWIIDVGEPRCPNTHGDPSVFTLKKVVLTTAHLNHTPEDCSDENLRAMCQGCHLWYDRAHHAETAAATRAAAAAAAGSQALVELVTAHCFWGWCKNVETGLDALEVHAAMEAHYAAEHTDDLERPLR